MGKKLASPTKISFMKHPDLLSTNSLHSSLSSCVCWLISGSKTRTLFSSSKWNPAGPSAIFVTNNIPLCFASASKFYFSGAPRNWPNHNFYFRPISSARIKCGLTPGARVGNWVKGGERIVNHASQYSVATLWDFLQAFRKTSYKQSTRATVSLH